MSTRYWEYRFVDYSASNDGDPLLVLCEVTLDESDRPTMHSPARIMVDDESGLQQHKPLVCSAFDKPVLRRSDFIGSAYGYGKYIDLMDYE